MGIFHIIHPRAQHIFLFFFFFAALRQVVIAYELRAARGDSNWGPSSSFEHANLIDLLVVSAPIASASNVFGGGAGWAEGGSEGVDHREETRKRGYQNEEGRETECRYQIRLSRVPLVHGQSPKLTITEV